MFLITWIPIHVRAKKDGAAAAPSLVKADKATLALWILCLFMCLFVSLWRLMGKPKSRIDMYSALPIM